MVVGAGFLEPASRRRGCLASQLEEEGRAMERTATDGGGAEDDGARQGAAEGEGRWSSSSLGEKTASHR
jgi:hypothetical protein